MNHQNVIAEAYRITADNPKMHWFGFWPSVLDILVGGAIFFYQTYATLFHWLHPDRSLLKTLKPIFDFASDNLELSIWVGVVSVILFLLRLVVPVIFDAGLIKAISAARSGHPISFGRGIIDGLLVFLPFFELNLVMGVFSITTIFVEMAFGYRNIPFDLFQFLLVPLSIFTLFAIFASIAMIYSEFFVILDNKTVRESIGASFRMVMENLRHTIVLGLLMVTIALRILVSIIIIIVLPLLVMWLFGSILLHLSLSWALSITFVVGLVLLYFSARLLGSIHVLVKAAWTVTYLDLRDQKPLE